MEAGGEGGGLELAGEFLPVTGRVEGTDAEDEVVVSPGLEGGEEEVGLGFQVPGIRVGAGPPAEGLELVEEMDAGFRVVRGE